MSSADGVDSVSNLSWKQDSFRAKLKLFWKSRREQREGINSSISVDRASAYSALSSTYYSIAGTAWANLGGYMEYSTATFVTVLQIVLWYFTWFPLGAWCYFRMLPLSNKMFNILGYCGMTADQCDIRQSILRRRGDMEEAQKCAEVGLQKKPHEYTAGLLHVALAEIHVYKMEYSDARRNTKLAVPCAIRCAETHPQQAVRIYRHCADLVDRLSMAGMITGKDLRKRAQEIARRESLADQILKMSR